MFKKNIFSFGLSVGALLPVLCFLLLDQMNGLTATPERRQLFDTPTLYVLSICINLVPFRYYMVKHKFDQTGKGILLATLLYAILFVVAGFPKD